MLLWCSAENQIQQRLLLFELRLWYPAVLSLSLAVPNSDMEVKVAGVTTLQQATAKDKTGHETTSSIF